MQEQVIQITGLHKSFGQIEAVRDLSIEVRRGQLFAFLGVNGAGKSTTIAMLCGQLTPDSGEVLVCGQNMRREPRAAMRKLGVVFQGSVLDRALSVRENLASRAALYGIRGATFRARLAELAQLLDFADLLNRPVGKLSGGSAAGSTLPERCCTSRRSWSSMSRPRGWTRRPAACCGMSSPSCSSRRG